MCCVPRLRTGVDETGRHYMKLLTQGADGRTYTTLECFLLQQRAENLRFVLHSAFRVLYGTAVVGVQAFASDGDGTLIDVGELLHPAARRRPFIPVFFHLRLSPSLPSPPSLRLPLAHARACWPRTPLTLTHSHSPTHVHTRAHAGHRRAQRQIWHVVLPRPLQVRC